MSSFRGMTLPLCPLLPSQEEEQVWQRAEGHGDSWVTGGSSGKASGVYSPALAGRAVTRTPGGGCHFTPYSSESPACFHGPIDCECATPSRWLGLPEWRFPRSQSGAKSGCSSVSRMLGSAQLCPLCTARAGVISAGAGPARYRVERDGGDKPPHPPPDLLCDQTHHTPR